MSNEANERGMLDNLALPDEIIRLSHAALAAALQYIKGKEESVTIPLYIFGRHLTITVGGKVDEA